MDLYRLSLMSKRLEREARLRLFQQMHQDDDQDNWRRASGQMYCVYCKLQYWMHPVEEIYNVDHRLCNGDIVHL